MATARSPHDLQEIHKRPGHLLSVRRGKLVSFSTGHAFSLDQLSEDEWAGLLWDGLCQSVRKRLVSDVPVGVFLSGGVDSAAIVAAAASVAPSVRFTTFSMGFEEPSYDETPYARAVAERFGTHHEQVMFTPDVARAEVPGLASDSLADPVVPLPHLAVTQTVTVTLGGDGGDELWGGYPTFLTVPSAARINRLPRPLLDTVARSVERLPSSARYGSIDFLLKLFVRGLGYPPDVQAQILMGGFTRPEQARLLARSVQDACGQFNPYDDIDDIMAGAGATHPVDRLSYHHCKPILPDEPW
jgi:asparagine synthase (glutamine-hydrolysing)